MSHFYVGVILPKILGHQNDEEDRGFEQGDEDDIENHIEQVLETYDENKKVKPYQRECSCKRWVTGNIVVAEADKIFGWTWKEMRASHNALSDEMSTQEEWEKKVNPRIEWERHENDLRLADALPDPECSECKGLGFYESTYNPMSKWDWYVVGGRWDGVIQNLPRESENGFNFGGQHHLIQYNVNLCSRVLENNFPFAFVTPEGEWIESGKMGWFGFVSSEKKDWPEQCKKILAGHKDHLIIGVDCHI